MMLGAAVVAAGSAGIAAVSIAVLRPAPVTGDGVAALEIDCTAPSHRISPHIYGVAYYPLTDARDGYLWTMRPTARRWGGNHTSRYNWRLGNAWNTAADWFFRNVNYTSNPSFSWRDFLRENHRRGVATALTVPMLGWVAKDTSSASFPVSTYGLQRNVDPYKGDAGDGYTPEGAEIPAPEPHQTSVRLAPAEVEAWVREVRKLDHELGRRTVDYYILDNEPMLWNSTHRDVHPEPVGYDELLARTVAYASAIRRADPRAKIAGPAAWGWPSYFFSAKDVKAGFFVKPDRRAHGDVPLLAWYLRELRQHEQRTGTRLIDVLDVHYYPQDLARDSTDPDTSARRLRATRSLWDPSYQDESWIEDRVQLLPRMSKLIADNYPGLDLSVGEYNFGGEKSTAGALALAEVLGRFGQHSGLTSAFYFNYPAQGSEALQAFRAYRDYDGQGGHFPDWSVATRGAPDVSLFAARDGEHQHLVAIALNQSAELEREARLTLRGCGSATVTKAYQYRGGSGLTPAAGPTPSAGQTLRTRLPPHSITIFELSTTSAARGR